MLKTLVKIAPLILALSHASIATAASKRVDERAIYRDIDSIEQSRIDSAASGYGELPEGPAIRDAVATHRKCLGRKGATPLSCHDSFDEFKGCKGLGDAQCKGVLASAWELYIERYEGILRDYARSQGALFLEQLEASNSIWLQHRNQFCPVSAQIWTSLEPQLYQNQMYRECLALLNARRADELRRLAFEIRYIQALPPEDRLE